MILALSESSHNQALEEHENRHERLVHFLRERVRAQSLRRVFLLFFQQSVRQLNGLNVTRHVVEVHSCSRLVEEFDAFHPDLVVLLFVLVCIVELVDALLLVLLIVLRYDDLLEAPGSFLRVLHIVLGCNMLAMLEQAKSLIFHYFLLKI